MPVTFNEPPIINGWIWDIDYNDRSQKNLLKVLEIFHVNSQTDKRYDAVHDWGLAYPEELIICEDKEILYQARQDFIDGKRRLFLQLSNGKLVFNDSIL